MNNKNDIKIGYRPEIDGFRAFAVIAVIINHINKDFLQSGYLGVDIFFVISGYVITSSLSLRSSKNFLEFISNFYVRRIKRLIPALIVYVIVLSILICFFNPNPGISLLSGISSLFGLSNIYLLNLSTDYFAQSTELNVFTHTWSLGVEEQFYFIFPFIIWFTGFMSKKRNGVRNLFITVLFLVILSLNIFVFLYSTNQSAAYFLMPSRFWEMAIGCLLFLSLQKNKVYIRPLEKISPLLILFLILIVMFLPISYAIPSTILVVILSSLLIACLRKETIIFNLFSKRSIVHIGLISYSLYLWHWGVLSISRWTIGIHWWSIPFQVGLIYLLALSSYKWIETPLRNQDWSNRKWKTILKAIFGLLISAASLLILGKPLKQKLYLGNQNINLKTPYLSNFKIDYECFDVPLENSYDHQKVLNKCLFWEKDNKQTLFFIGDSHNYHFWQGAEYVANKTKSNLFTFSNGGSTFPSQKYFHIFSRERNLKGDQIMKSLEKEIMKDFRSGDVLFITLSLPYHFGIDWYRNNVNEFRFFDDNNEVIKRKSKKGHFEAWLNSVKVLTEELSKRNVKVVLSTPTPEFPQYSSETKCRKYNPQWFNKYSTVDCSFKYPLEFFNSKDGKYAYLIKRLKEVSIESNNLYLFDSLSVMCPGLECKYSAEGKLLYTDNDHLSNFAVRYLIAPKMIEFLKYEKILTNR